MAVYKSSEELKGKPLRYRDKFFFDTPDGLLIYELKSHYLEETGGGNNSLILHRILKKACKMKKKEFCSRAYGYVSYAGTDISFPEFHHMDFMAAYNVVMAIFKHCEELRKEAKENGDIYPF